MYTRIVVTLDGSKTAECVLPHLDTVAKGCGTQEVILLSVTELVTGTVRKVQTGTGPVPPYNPVLDIPRSIGKKQQQAEKYLARIARKLKAERFMVSTQVLVGNPAEEIVRYVKEKECDLIVMASHGRSGINRWAHSIGSYGGVADKILRASPVPVLMVKATTE